MFTLMQEAPGNLVASRVSGRMTYQDYEQFTESLERRMREQGRVRVLLELEDFHGWDFGAAWAEFAFGLKHLGQLERCAVVGDHKWEEWLTDFGKPFFRVRYFDHSEEEQARQWLREPETGPSQTWLGRIGELASRRPIACAAGSVVFGFLLGSALAKWSPRR